MAKARLTHHPESLIHFSMFLSLLILARMNTTFARSMSLHSNNLFAMTNSTDTLNPIKDDSKLNEKFMLDDSGGNDPTSSRALMARDGPSVPVYSTCTNSGSFSLTFDDGPSQFSSKLDSSLRGSGMRASFFINGNNFGCIYDYADLLMERFQRGDLIASHTWSHVHLNQCSYEQVSTQLELLENAMIKILGVKPLYFRPPYGEFNDLTLQVLKDRGYKGLILWSQDSQDSSESPPSPSQIIEGYNSYPEKTIILNHETKQFVTDEVIPAVLPILQSKGFQLLTSPDCLSLGSNPSDWYTFVQKPSLRDDSWTCNGTPSPGSN